MIWSVKSVSLWELFAILLSDSITRRHCSQELVTNQIVIRGRAVLDSALLNAPFLDGVTADLSNKDVAIFFVKTFQNNFHLSTFFPHFSSAWYFVSL